MTTEIRERNLSQLKKEIQNFSEFLSNITSCPPKAFEKEFYSRLNRIDQKTRSLSNPDRKELYGYFTKKCQKELHQSDLIRHSREKPMGYAGDYLIIDWIYTSQNGSKGNGKLWDDFFHRQAAPKSVRNRKNFLSYIFNSMVYEKGRSISVLDLACGPCRDISDLLSQANPVAYGSHFHCVDIDTKALAYAKLMMEKHQERATFEWEFSNVYRLKPKRKYDLVWVSGLFDYLNDRMAVTLIKKMWRWVQEDGRIVVGNFHPTNPSRNFMEWCGQWFLIHRLEQDFRNICKKAGIPEHCINFDREPLGVCIFLIIDKKTVANLNPSSSKISHSVA